MMAQQRILDLLALCVFVYVLLTLPLGVMGLSVICGCGRSWINFLVLVHGKHGWTILDSLC